jgi:hypothetical protein
VQVFVIFDDCREATKMLQELQSRPIELNSSDGILLQCLVVQRSIVESVSENTVCQLLLMLQEMSEHNFRHISLFPEASVILEVIDQETSQSNVMVSSSAFPAKFQKLMNTFGDVMRTQEIVKGNVNFSCSTTGLESR